MHACMCLLIFVVAWYFLQVHFLIAKYKALLSSSAVCGQKPREPLMQLCAFLFNNLPKASVSGSVWSGMCRTPNLYPRIIVGTLAAWSLSATVWQIVLMQALQELSNHISYIVSACCKVDVPSCTANSWDGQWAHFLKGMTEELVAPSRTCSAKSGEGSAAQFCVQFCFEDKQMTMFLHMQQNLSETGYPTDSLWSKEGGLKYLKNALH